LISVAVDTNVLAYAEGTNGAAKQQAALELLRALPAEHTLLPAQTLGELFNVLVKKARWTRADAQGAVLAWGDAFPLIETSPDVVLAAMDLASRHQLGIWDAIVLAAASDAGCRLLLSEDLQEGFTWSGVTVANPFLSPRHPLLDALTRPQAAEASRTDGKGRAKMKVAFSRR
jgi:predicted nucleic acid-binding protein